MGCINITNMPTLMEKVHNGGYEDNLTGGSCTQPEVKDT